MPRIQDIPGPYWFFFYSFDCNEPIHVHVRRERRTCKFWLEPIQLAANDGFTASVLKPKFVYKVRSPNPSFPRKWESGFTFQVQQVTNKNFCRSFVVKTLSGSVVIGTNQGEQALVGQSG